METIQLVFDVKKHDLVTLHDAFTFVFPFGYESKIIDTIIDSFIYTTLSEDEMVRQHTRGAWNFPLFTTFHSTHTMRFHTLFGRQTLHDKKTGVIFSQCFWDMHGKKTGPVFQYHLTQSGDASSVLHFQGCKVNGVYNGPYKEWSMDGVLCVDGMMKDDRPYIPYRTYWPDGSGLMARRTMTEDGESVLFEEFKRGDGEPWLTYTVPLDDMDIMQAFCHKPGNE